MTEFLSALAGAIMGGLISFGIQMLIFRQAKAERNEQAHEERVALAHSFLFKLIQIHSHLKSLTDHVTNSLDEGRREDAAMEPWQAVRGLGNHPDKIEFSAAEMALLLRLKKDQLFNDAMALDERHNAAIDLSKLYAQKRGELIAAVPARMAGNLLEIPLAPDDLARLMPRMLELNQLIGTWVEYGNADVVQAASLMRAVHSELKAARLVTFAMNDRAPAAGSQEPTQRGAVGADALPA